MYINLNFRQNRCKSEFGELKGKPQFAYLFNGLNLKHIPTQKHTLELPFPERFSFF